MRKFKRSIQSNLNVIIGLPLILGILSFWVAYLFGDTLPPAFITLSVVMLILGLLVIIVDFALLPDFEYSIRVQNDIIIFEMDEEDHRRINKSFTIVSKDRKHLVISDGISRIRIAYNKEVLDFLNEIHN